VAVSPQPDGRSYEAFNEAVAEELFGLDQAGRPVYLLPDATAYDAIFKRAGADAGDAGLQDLLEAVRRTLVLDASGVNPFKQHLSGSTRHGWNPIETPPSLAMLVVLAGAADAMHAGDGMAANNYYGRLVTLLDVPAGRQERFKSAYQGVAEDLWGSLNAWLEAWEGERGIPTAYAVGQRFIGLPMSQALVRQHDRERLKQVFAAEGLPPGYQMANADMEAVLDGWVNRQPSILSNALRILWTNAAARERIAGVACLELEVWRGDDASTATAQTTRYGAVRLMAQLRMSPRPMVVLNLTVPAPADTNSPTVTLAGADGPVVMRLAPAGPGSLRLEDARRIDAASLLADEVSLTVADANHALTRLPRRLVPMRFDDLQNCYVEVERVQLGEQSIVFAAESLRSKVEPVLRAVARPGWTVLDESTDGVPEGWLVYRGVQVFDRFTGSVHVDLQPLLPRSSATLVLSGGFSLPGRLRKWSSLDPPEIQAVTPDGSGLRIRVDSGDRLGNPVLIEEVESSVAVLPLTRASLPDGEYMVTLWIDDAKKPSASSLLRLRSGDSPVRELAGRASGLVYRPSAGALWPLAATSPDGTPDVDGARASVPAAVDPGVDMPPAKPRSRPSAPAATSRRLVRVGRGLGDDSCMRTGMHRFILPPVLPGRPVSASIEGECTTCGLVKRFAGTASRARKRAPKAVSQTLDLSALPPVTEDDSRDHAIAFDGLCHLGNGSASDFARIASQVEGNALFADVLLRTLEVLGHVDVRRHTATLRLEEFELTPATLVQLDDDLWWLVGRIPDGMVKALAGAVDAVGGAFEDVPDQGVPRRTLSCTWAQIDSVLGSDERFAEVGIVTSAALTLAGALPPLSSVAGGLARSPVPAFDALAQWETAAARWTPATSIARAGAYRLGGFAPLYGLRSPEDLERGTIAIASPQLAKHVANLWVGDPLAGYHEASGSVVVPLGCDVPGLYGRALALCSGRVPVVASTARMLQYPNVPRDVAAFVHTRLFT